MKPEILLHIGLHKSGTSSIQNFLSGNAEALARQGICYPRAGRRRIEAEGEYLAHHQLATRLNPKFTDREELSRIREAFRAEVAGHDRVLVSSEGFARIRDFDAFDWFFEGFRLRAIVYVRELADYAVAAYQEAVQGSDLYCSFDFYLTHFKVNLPAIIRLWRERCAAVIVRPFARPLLRGGDLIEDFCHEAGIAGLDTARASWRNPSISGNLLTFKLLFNQFHPHGREIYGALGRLAEGEARFRGKFHVPDRRLAEFRALGRGGYTRYMGRVFPDMPEPSFGDAPPMLDAARWAEDLGRILAEPLIERYRDAPPFGHGALALAAQ